ncbi:MAG: flippase-like domain-containing protein [Deltaproteobacteria bacterium]|nr:flippase-like domain-containing protein [Deltaproteobacteria bacterium]
MKIWIKRLLAVLVLALVIWQAKKIDFTEVKSAILAANPLWIILSLVGLAVVWLCRSSILWFVFQGRNQIKWSLAALATMLGGMMDLIIPGRSGYFVRWAVLSLKSKASKGFVLSAVASAVLLEGIVLLLLFLGAFIFSPELGEMASPLITFFFSLFVVFLFFCFLFSDSLENFLLSTPLKKFSAVEALFEITRRLKEPKAFFIGLGLPSIAWGAQIFILYCLAKAFGFHLSVFQMVFLIFSVNLAILVPVVPGNIGTIQIVIVAVLAKFAIEKDHALAFAIVFHAVQVIPVLIVGGILSFFFPISKQKWRQVEEAQSH